MADQQPVLGIRSAVLSDVGRQRDQNEDAAYAGTRLLAVADGLGGHVGGEHASAAVIRALTHLDAARPGPDLVPALAAGVQQANDALNSLVESDPGLLGMGTTLTAMLLSGGQLALAQIGDSRAYLLRDHELVQITHDQTLVQALVDDGRITPAEAMSHPQRSLLLQALDGGEVIPDLQLREARLGDRYLLCSDGLTAVVTPRTIQQVLAAAPDPESAVSELIDLANEGGGPDNITCVVADLIDQSGPGPG